MVEKFVKYIAAECAGHQDRLYERMENMETNVNVLWYYPKMKKTRRSPKGAISSVEFQKNCDTLIVPKGIDGWLRRAKECVFCPGMSPDIWKYISSFDTSSKFTTEQL